MVRCDKALFFTAVVSLKLFSNSPELPWTKGSLYEAKSWNRPFRIFLNPELDYAPEPEFLPQWKVLYFKKQNDMNALPNPRFLIHTAALRSNNGVTEFYLLRESSVMKNAIRREKTFHQWYAAFFHKTHEIRVYRSAIFDSNANPVEFAYYSLGSEPVLNESGPGWDAVRTYLIGEPGRVELRRRDMMKKLRGVPVN